MNIEYDIDTNSNYYKETASLMAYKDNILRNPKTSLTNTKKFGTVMLILFVCTSGAIIYDAIRFKSYIPLILYIIFVIPFLSYIRRCIEYPEADCYSHHCKIELTKEGIKEILTNTKAGTSYTQEVNFTWNTIKHIIEYNESIALCFEGTYKPIICIKKEYKEELLDFLEKNNLKVQYIKKQKN